MSIAGKLIGTAGLHGGELQAASAASGVLACHLAGIAVTLVLGGVAIVLLGLPTGLTQQPRQSRLLGS